MLKTRIITAVCLLAFLLGAIFFLPRMAWYVCCSLICALAAWEWGGLACWGGNARIIYAMALGIACHILLIPSLPSAACAIASCNQSYWDFIQTFESFALCLIASVFWLLIVPLWLRYKWPLRKWNAALVGFVVIVPTALVFALLQRHSDPLFLISIIAVVWVADISAYFTGRAFGGRKLAPDISPGKTWAGAIGAVIGVLLYCNILVFAGIRHVFGHFPQVLLFQSAFIGLAVMSIVGDLFESMLKRQAGVKDSSHLLPGHGGILDRIDSLTSTLTLIGVLFIF
jgi:phosphatidate cytidylyltransferase